MEASSQKSLRASQSTHSYILTWRNSIDALDIVCNRHTVIPYVLRNRSDAIRAFDDLTRYRIYYMLTVAKYCKSFSE